MHPGGGALGRLQLASILAPGDILAEEPGGVAGIWERGEASSLS